MYQGPYTLTAGKIQLPTSGQTFVSRGLYGEGAAETVRASCTARYAGWVGVYAIKLIRNSDKQEQLSMAGADMAT